MTYNWLNLVNYNSTGDLEGEVKSDHREATTGITIECWKTKVQIQMTIKR